MNLFYVQDMFIPYGCILKLVKL